MATAAVAETATGTASTDGVGFVALNQECSSWVFRTGCILPILCDRNSLEFRFIFPMRCDR